MCCLAVFRLGGIAAMTSYGETQTPILFALESVTFRSILLQDPLASCLALHPMCCSAGRGNIAAQSLTHALRECTGKEVPRHTYAIHQPQSFAVPDVVQ